jgi:nucleotide-binding universal stress UspA family protein
LNNILVPLAEFSELSLNAAQYAVEFAKRSSSKPIFLFFSRNECANDDRIRTDCHPTIEKEGEVREKIEFLIERSALIDGLAIERHTCSGEYIEKVCEFVRDLNITQIVIAIPDEQDELYAKIMQDISLLIQMTPCRVLTVKEKDKDKGD